MNMFTNKMETYFNINGDTKIYFKNKMIQKFILKIKIDNIRFNNKYLSTWLR